MAPNLQSSPDALGDINHRDAIIRHKYQRANGPVSSSFHTISSNVAYNTVTYQTSLSSDSSGLFSVYCKPSGNTSIDSNSQAAVLSVATAQTTVTSNVFQANGNLWLGNTSPTTLSSLGGSLSVGVPSGGNVVFSNSTGNSFATFSETGLVLAGNQSITFNEVVFSQSGNELDITLPSSGNTTSQLSFIGSSGSAFSTISESGTYVYGTLSVDSDALFTSDLNCTGDTTLYGDLAVNGNVTLDSQQLVLGNGASNLASTGLLVGSMTSPSASFLYEPTAATGNAAAWVSSVPLVYQGETTTAELGDSGGLKVWTSNNTSEYVNVSSTCVSFNGEWRLRFDSSNNKMVFENYNSGTWNTKFTVQ